MPRGRRRGRGFLPRSAAHHHALRIDTTATPEPRYTARDSLSGGRGHRGRGAPAEVDTVRHQGAADLLDRLTLPGVTHHQRCRGLDRQCLPYLRLVVAGRAVEQVDGHEVRHLAALEEVDGGEAVRDPPGV